MKKIFSFILFVCITNISLAQVHEAGIFIGGTNYVGDIGSTNIIDPNAFGYGVIYKWNYNPRIAFRGSLTQMNIKGVDAESNNEIRQSFQNKFKKSVTEITGGIELNFWEYNLSKRGFQGTFYTTLEAGAFQYPMITGANSSTDFEFENKIGFAIPFGVGYKGRLYKQFSFAIEARIRYTFTDDLDDSLFIKEEVLPNSDPTQKPYINREKFNNPDTNDWYMVTGVSLFYTFGRPPCYSNLRH